TRFPSPVHHALIAIPSLGGQRLARLARSLSVRYLTLGIMRDMFGLADLSLRPRSLGDCMALEVRNSLLDPVNMAVKRAFDLLVAAPLALAALPIIALAALTVKLVSPGPTFFAQEREGLRGGRIRVWKVRTMVPDAEALLGRHLAENAEAREEWARYVKLRNDPRVIPVVGRFLRRSSVDELPQLWSVLRGEMSLVGPRPFTEYHLVQFPQEFRDLRRQAIPGMTGLWQVTCRSEGDLRAQEQMDTHYIRNWSMWMDLWVLLRTAGAVMGGSGAY
ncbi:MAG TPA: sugar transferase, partial [Dehalococcoidia bacterium]|nr:sugar transferase [Dehalococcoidia bacterium]